MLVRPAVAREVLLAILVEEPDLPPLYGERVSLGRNQLAVRHDHTPYRPVPLHRSLLSFFTVSFDEGLEVVVRLVNFTFDRWCELEDICPSRNANCVRTLKVKTSPGD